MQKARYFTFLVYPDSAPANWVDELRDSHGSFAISPLHQPDDGDEQGKPHFHVIYCHGNTASLEAARQAIPEDVPANGKIEIVTAPRNYQRYLLHLDDPDKQQFPGGSKEITLLGCFPLDLSRDFSAAERAAQRAKVFSIIRENGLVEYADLLDGLMDEGWDDLFDWAFNHTIALTHYLASCRGRLAYADDPARDEVQGTESPVDD